MRLEAPWNPSLITVMSTLRISPGLSTRSPGVPWQTRWVSEGRRNGVLAPDHVVVAQVVQLAGGDARLHVKGDEVEHLAGQPPGDAHALQLFRSLQYNGH